MDLRLSNQLNMIGTCLDLANSEDYHDVWSGQPPTDFTADIYALGLKYNNARAKAALVTSPSGGAVDQKAVAETALENAAFILARALANHFKKKGDLVKRGKVNLSRREIVRLRENDLIGKATEIRDLATGETTDPTAEGRGITAARITTLNEAITNFSTLKSLPRGQIVNRGALLRDLETDIAEMMDDIHDLDDLVVLFDTTEEGKLFIDAWKHARIIVDLTAGGATPATPTPPTPPGP
jgi:hypothetical protein